MTAKPCVNVGRFTDPDVMLAAITSGISQLHLIGDAHAPGLIAQAVFSGHRLAREIDSPDPDVPLPFIRERRLVGATEEDYRLGAPTLQLSSRRLPILSGPGGA